MGVITRMKGFNEARTRFVKFVAQVPTIIGNTAVDHFKSSFRNKGFRDEVFVPWKPRKKGKRNTGRAILVDTGRLRRSIRILIKTKDRVRVGTIGIPYAQIHNEGFKGIEHVRPHKRQNIIRAKVYGSFEGTAKKRKYKTVELLGNRHNVKGFSRKMNIPKRQFIGQSTFLNRYLEIKIAQGMKKIF